MYELSVSVFLILLAQSHAGYLESTTLSSTTIEPVNEIDSLLASVARCGIDTGANRILGGVSTELDEFPWLALLFYRRPFSETSNHGCGGSLINQRYVMTAAHCLTGKVIVTLGTLVAVRLGEYDTQQIVDCLENDDCADPAQDIPVHVFHVHPEYSENDRTSANDIGLVRLSQRANYNDFVMPICLLTLKTSSYTPGTQVYVAGWGKNENGKSSRYKLKVRLPVYDKSECITKYLRKIHAPLNEKQLCIGGEFNKDACNGDSGGPAMMITQQNIWEAIGIISFGRGCGAQGRPAVYTNVYSYLDWIKRTIRDNNV